jgi:hypothetical protein
MLSWPVDVKVFNPLNHCQTSTKNLYDMLSHVGWLNICVLKQKPFGFMGQLFRGVSLFIPSANILTPFGPCAGWYMVHISFR